MFFSFPHIAIDSDGKIGAIARPNRPGASAACGALIKSWNEIRAEGLTCNCKIPGGEYLPCLWVWVELTCQALQ